MFRTKARSLTILLIVSLLLLPILPALPARGQNPTTITWDTQADFENNAFSKALDPSTTWASTATSRTNVDTETVLGAVKLAPFDSQVFGDKQLTSPSIGQAQYVGRALPIATLTDSANNIISIWLDHDYNTVYAQKFSPNGQPLTGPTLLVGLSGFYYYSLKRQRGVVLDSNNNLFVVWQDYPQPNPPIRHLNKYDSNFNLLWSKQLPDTPEWGNYLQPPSVTINSSNSVIVSWIGDTGNVYASWLDNNGNIITNNSFYRLNSPVCDVMVAGSKNSPKVWFVYLKDEGGSNYNLTIDLAEVTPLGDLSFSVYHVYATPISYRVGLLDAVTDSSSALIFAWYEYPLPPLYASPAFIKKYDSSGNAFWPTLQLSSGSSNVRLGIDLRNDDIIPFWEEGNGNLLYTERLSASGNLLHSKMLVSSHANNWAPSLTSSVDSTGGVVFSWAYNDYDIYRLTGLYMNKWVLGPPEYQTAGSISNLKIHAGTGVKGFWSNISWLASTPPGTAVKFRTRGADTEAGLANATWSEYYLTSGSTIMSPPSEWLEVEGTLTGDGTNTPILESVTVTTERHATSLSYSGDLIQATGGQAVLNAKLTDAVSGLGITGKAVSFTLGSQTIDAVTNSDGVATAPLTISQPQGIYTVTANFAGDDLYLPSSSTPSYFVVYDPLSGMKATGGGWIGTTSGKANLGFNVEYKNGAAVPSGQLQYRDHGIDLTVHSAAFDWLVFMGNTAIFEGSATVNGITGYSLRVEAVDYAEPGSGIDSFSISIRDAQGVEFYKAGGILQKGNIQVHY